MDSPQFLDRSREIEKLQKYCMTHWEQYDTVQFITFRLADSLPQSVIAEIKERQELFKRNFREPWDEETLRRYNAIASPLEKELLDNGYGDCVLKNPEVRHIVIDTLLLDNGEKYDLWSLVIMPNHVHMLISVKKNYKLHQIIGSFMSITSHKINKILNRKGKLWQSKYYDRLIRNENHFEICRAYIANNPRNLPPNTYTLLHFK
ncbi:MAG: hypothetical protein HDR87_09885 [Bacteroides sp.]|nr:hypothetical protein [Bacteroides sp.]MBD5294062.1 hypothetical protein [Bacteroides sp.]MBD5360999.1 hypothetical protein [Bacteroides sp.]